MVPLEFFIPLAEIFLCLYVFTEPFFSIMEFYIHKILNVLSRQEP